MEGFISPEMQARVLVKLIRDDDDTEEYIKRLSCLIEAHESRLRPRPPLDQDQGLRALTLAMDNEFELSCSQSVTLENARSVAGNLAQAGYALVPAYTAVRDLNTIGWFIGQARLHGYHTQAHWLEEFRRKLGWVVE